MDGTPEDVSLEELSARLAGIEGVRDVHHIHAWALTSGKYVFSGHLRIEDDADSHAVLEAAQRMLRDEFSFAMVTLQVETACLDEGWASEFDITAQDKGRAHHLARPRPRQSRRRSLIEVLARVFASTFFTITAQ